MCGKFRFDKVLFYQSAGFLAIVLLSWFDEFTHLRSLILGSHPYISDFKESTLEMLFVLVIWFLVMGYTRRLMQRLDQLEALLRVCSWCRRIRADDGWMQFEEFIALKFDTKTSHVICQDCLTKQMAELENMRRQRLLALEDPAAPKPSDGSVPT
jgi:hypothetical protein